MKKIFIIIMFCLYGCALFKKTSRSSSQNSHNSINQLEASQLVLKRTGKETQVFSYWSDSGFYQVQTIREQVDQAASGKIISEEKQQSKQDTKVKETEPVNWLLYIGIAVVLAFVIALSLFRK